MRYVARVTYYDALLARVVMWLVLFQRKSIDCDCQTRMRVVTTEKSVMSETPRPKCGTIQRQYKCNQQHQQVKT